MYARRQVSIDDEDVIKVTFAEVFSLVAPLYAIAEKHSHQADVDSAYCQARDFALAEIIKLTDSYRDMKINKVLSAETARSVY